MNKLSISKAKIYNTNSERIGLEDRATSKLAQKVQDLTQDLFVKNKLSGKFEFRVTGKGIKIIQKGGKKFTLNNSKKTSQEILKICEQFAAKQSRKSGNSSGSDVPDSSLDASSKRPSKFSAFGIAPKTTPLAPQQPNAPAPLIPGAVNAAPGVNVQQLLDDHVALERAHDALQRNHFARGRTIDELTRTLATAQEDQAAKGRTIDELAKEFRALTQQKDAVQKQVKRLEGELELQDERYAQLYSGVEKVSAENTALTKKAVWREQEIARLNEQLQSLNGRYQQLAQGIGQKDADFKGEKDSLQSQLAAAKASLAEIREQQTTSTHRISVLEREKGAIESQSREALLAMTSQKESAESRASQAHLTIESMTSAKDIAVARAEQAERTNITLKREKEDAVSNAGQAQLTIEQLRSQKEIAVDEAAQLRPALEKSEIQVASLTEQNQITLQQLAAKTEAAVSAQQTLAQRDRELSTLGEQSTITSQKVDEQAATILQLEAALQQSTEENERLTAQRLDMQARFQQIEEEHRLDVLAPAAPASSVTRLEHEQEVSRLREANIELEETYRIEMQQQTDLIRQLQSTLASETQKSEKNGDKRASLERQIEKQEGVIANLRKRLDAQRQQTTATIQKAILGLQQKLDQKQGHVEYLQARQAVRIRELEQGFQESTQYMEEELDRLQAVKKQLTTANQQMSKKLADQEKEIRELTEWENDQSQEISRLYPASIHNRSLRQELEESTAKLASAEKQISGLEAKIERHNDWFEAAKAEIIKLRREIEENTSEDGPMLVAEIERQEQLLKQAGTMGKALIEQNALLQEENAALKEDLDMLTQHKTGFEESMSRVGVELEKSAQLARAIQDKYTLATPITTDKK